MKPPCLAAALSLSLSVAFAQTPAPTPPAAPSYVPLGIPAPGPVTDAPYAPQPILPGGIVVPLYAPASPRLNRERIREAEKYNYGGSPGRIQSIVNIHNPSIEVHRVDDRSNTGTAVIVVAGGGHRTLNVGTEGGDFVPFFYNYASTPSSSATACASTVTSCKRTR